MNKTTPFIRTIQYNNYNVLQFLKGFETTSPDSVTDLLSKSLSDKKPFFVNCTALKSLPDSWYQWIKSKAEPREHAGLKTGLIFASEEFRGSLAKSANPLKLPFFPDLHSALGEFNRVDQTSAQMHFIKTFVNSTRNVFYAQSQINTEVMPISIKNDDKHLLMGDVSGIIEVATQDMNYAVILAFPKDTFLTVVNRLLGESYTEISNENIDAAVVPHRPRRPK